MSKFKRDANELLLNLPQECLPFWPSCSGASMFFEVGSLRMKVSMLDEVDTATWKAFRLSLEVSHVLRDMNTSRVLTRQPKARTDIRISGPTN